LAYSRTRLPSAFSGGELRLRYRLRGRSAFEVRASLPDGDHITEANARHIQSSLHPVDLAILREMRAATVFGQLSDAQLARLIPVLAQREAELPDGDLRLGDGAMVPRVRVHMGEAGVELTVGLVDEDGDWFDLTTGRTLVGNSAYFLLGRTAFAIDSPAPWELAMWVERPVRRLSGEVDAVVRDALVAGLRKLGVPTADLAALEVQRQPPDEIKATISWRAAEAHLDVSVRYGDAWTEVGFAQPANIYLSVANRLIERDLQAEAAVRSLLRAHRLRYDPATGRFVAADELAIAFLDPARQLLPAEWTVERVDAPSFHRDVGMHAAVRLLEDRGLLEVDVELDVAIDIPRILKWLTAGRHYLALEDGSFVAPSAESRQRLAVLEDLGMRGRRVLVSPMCVGLLRLLGDEAGVAAADARTAEWLREIASDEAPRDVGTPAAVTATLRDYQRHGVNWLAMMERHRLAGILADDMGLGKTLQALTLIAHLKAERGPQPSLVVAPTSVTSVWCDEAARFAPSLRMIAYVGPPEQRATMSLNDVDIVVTSYGILRRDVARLQQHNFRYVILDEAQAAKNARTQNAQAIRALQSEHRLALSGTPLENRAEELWATFDFLAPGFLGTLRSFRKRYAKPIGEGEAEAMTLLRTRIRPFVLRRLKREVAAELPPKTETLVRCHLGTSQQALYDHVAASARKSVLDKVEADGLQNAQLDILAALTRLRQICCDPRLLPVPPVEILPPSAKLALFSELMREALGSDRTVVVFSQFVQMQRILIDVIAGMDVQPLWLHGGTTDRGEVVRRFQDPDGPRVIVVSLRAGGTGVTLTRADTVIHYDPWWNPAVERQATDRTHRLGQTQSVNVYKLVCAGTVEEKVVAMAAGKERLSDDLLGSEGSLPKRITQEEVLALLGAS
jgi:hypothetical protein